MTKVSGHLDDRMLEVLLLGEEVSREYQEFSAHVETCSLCQSRLETLSGFGEIDTRYLSMLSSESLDHSRRSHSERDPVAGNSLSESDRIRHSLDFLTPPGHPELLGRLGRYDIESVIGSGGMGVVLKGFDTELNRPVAIKVLAAHLAHNGTARQRFSREAKAAAAIVHEHVVAIHNVETNEHSSSTGVASLPFLVMQYVAGESLQERIDREGALDPKEVLRIGIQAAAGLAAAHEQGVLHRDIKPANILLERGVERVLLTDFGLARTVDDASLTQTGIVAGTPHYMSPEQSNGGTSDHRTDLFSLGSVLYFMATGRPPFRAERAMGVLHRICHERHRPIREINPDVPIELSRVIDRLLAKKPNRRFPTASAVRDELREILLGIQSGRRSSNPFRLLAIGACSILAVGLIGFVYQAYLNPSPDTALQKTEPSVANPQVSRNSKGITENPRQRELLESMQDLSTTARNISKQLDVLEATFDSSFSLPQSDFSQQVQGLNSRLDELLGE